LQARTKKISKYNVGGLMRSVLQLLLFIGIFFSVTQEVIKAQECDIMYFCVRYSDNGEEGCSDQFTTGNITVMIRLAGEIYYTDVSIQIDKYNPRAGKFEYHKEFPFTVNPELTYVYFNDIYFDKRGFYRVFLLDPSRNTITSALVEII
jgi:hypothetical protein